MKIRGNTIGTPIKPEKNIIKATDLTEEEKAQARANIGAAAVGETGAVPPTDELVQAVIDALPVYDGSYTELFDSPLPTEIATDVEMTAILENDETEVGSVYKYTGESGTYENGALYVVEESE